MDKVEKVVQKMLEEKRKKPTVTSTVKGIVTITAKVIRKDGAIEDLGIISKGRTG